MEISLSSIKEVWKVRRMSKLQVVRNRLKNKELYSRTPIAASMDVAFLFAEEMRQRPQGTVGLLNINTKGQVINVQFGDIETFRNVREVISATILSNAAASVMISNVDITDDMKLLTSRYKYALQLCSITLVDHVCISRSAGCKSYLSKGIMDDLKDGSNIQSTVKRLDIDSGKSQDLVRVRSETERFFKNGEKTPVSKESAVDMVAKDIAYMDREALYVISFQNSEPVNAHMVSQGSLSEAVSEPREIFKVPLLTGATSVILMHNHPSGSTDPSFSDIYTTIRMQNAGKLLGIEVEDHIIVGALSEQKQSILESDEYRKQLSKLADELHIEFKNIKDQQPVFKPSGISGKKLKKERKETEKSKASQKGANDKFIKDYIQQAHNGSVAEREREHEK